QALRIASLDELAQGQFGANLVLVPLEERLAVVAHHTSMPMDRYARFLSPARRTSVSTRGSTMSKITGSLPSHLRDIRPTRWTVLPLALSGKAKMMRDSRSTLRPSSASDVAMTMGALPVRRSSREPTLSVFFVVPT